MDFVYQYVVYSYFFLIGLNWCSLLNYFYFISNLRDTNTHNNSIFSIEMAKLSCRKTVVKLSFEDCLI